jgi:hypothetical protein
MSLRGGLDTLNDQTLNLFFFFFFSSLALWGGRTTPIGHKGGSAKPRPADLGWPATPIGQKPKGVARATPSYLFCLVIYLF